LRHGFSFIKQLFNGLQNGSYVWCGNAGGTGNAVTLTPSPAISAYAAGQVFRFKAANSNSGATTLAISGLTAIDVQVGGVACTGGEIISGQWYEVLLSSSSVAQLRTVASALNGGQLTNLLKFKAGANIASATTVNLSTATGNTVHITGTTTITGWTLTAGQRMTVIFDGAVPLTYNATTNKINGGASVTTAAGDFAEVFYDGTTTYVNLTHASGSAIAGPAYSSTVAYLTTGLTLTSADMGKCIGINAGGSVNTTHTLPLLSTVSDGATITLFNLNTGLATFNVSGSDIIYGLNLVAASSLVVGARESFTLSKSSLGTWAITASSVNFSGAPQTVQNVTASRAIGTTYTNSTGRDITVYAIGSYSASAQGGSIVIDGSTVYSTGNGTAGASTWGVTFLVPKGSTYAMTSFPGLTKWSEYR
jgi:hypothetical protein